MSATARPIEVGAGRLALPGRAAAALAILLPVVVVALVLALAVGARLQAFGGNITGFVHFGSAFEAFTQPPRGAAIETGRSSAGYDGQFYYLIARDPLLLHDSTVTRLRDAPQNAGSQALGSSNQAYRLQRVAYPALAFLVARVLGLTTASAMLAVNVAVVLILAAGFGYYARRRGWSPLWAVALALLPGLLLATLRDLPTPLAVTCALGGLLAYAGTRRKLAVALLAVAVLAREVMIVAVLAIAVDAAARCLRDRAAARRIAREAWPAVALPMLAFGAWYLYVCFRSGGTSGGAGVTLPVVHFATQVGAAVADPDGMIVWEVAYVLLMLVASGAAARAFARRQTVVSAAAALFALTFLVAPFNDVWGEARDSLPMLALLLVIGLERRDSRLLAICSAAAAMTALVPLAIPGSF